MEKSKRRFTMLAYTGATVFFPFWGKAVFDLKGLNFKLPMPALRQHTPDRAVGIIDMADKASKLRAGGYFVNTPDGREVEALLSEGFPFQASMGIFVDGVEEVKKEESSQVNGEVFSGPGVIIRQSHVREISFVAVGADADTSVTSLAASASPGGQGGAAPEDFFQAVKAMLGRGLPVRAAIRAAAKAWPEIFQAHLDEIGHSGGYEDLDLGPAPSCPFEAKVREVMAAGKTRGQAVKEIARDFPDLHEGFLDRINA